MTHRERMRVAWADTDAGGRIHHTAAFRWAEVAEHAMLRGLGLDSDAIVSFPRRHIEVTYHLPLRFSDEFDLLIAPEHTGRTSITYAWQAVQGDRVCVEGRTVAVHVNDQGHPITLPEALATLS
ncbi:thioesterase family protein [Nonomuraea sp. NPDC005650]|uniref:acyl-CoA thioesterase n=1 Tax=Nonomuraea sp. NPDC005650 TaxID=3157045 RepID=UPI0033B5E336